MIDLLHGDALDIFRRPEVQGLNAIVADLPGGGEFMGLAFDHHLGGRGAWINYWAARLRVAREATERGSWGLFWAFGRTAHWTACALDDAGWEVVRPILHVHGQGWPKARSQLKPAQEVWWLVRWGGVTPLQIDRCRVRRSGGVPVFKGDGARLMYGETSGEARARTGETSDAGSWPPDLVLSHCPACREVGMRKVRGSSPASGPTHVGESAPRTRGRMNGATKPPAFYGEEQEIPAWECLAACVCGLASLSPAGGEPTPCPGCGEERWWACPVAEMDGQSGDGGSGTGRATIGGAPRKNAGQMASRWDSEGARDRSDAVMNFGDSGGASRFFPIFHYDAKASRAERQAGCEGLLWIRDKQAPIGWRRVDQGEWDRAGEKDRAQGNVHATIKPIGAGEEDGLMRWLARLITPPGGRVGDITAGSGSTGAACQIEGHDFLGCDIDPGAVDIARARLAFWTPERHRLELTQAAALRAEEKRQEEAKERGQLDWTKGI